ncbi:MAG: winged helix-turn-helix transcriptional regulator [Anaerolineaceae bacterium]|nr:winged helix-turn-helix transcriptional regulator [Anaerolineaceae bacterium]
MTEQNRDLIILEKIEQDPNVTQASIASQLGVAVGTVNWHVKRLIQKGYIKVRRVARRKLLYIITPEGLALRANLTLDYIQSSFELYRLVRNRVQVALARLDEHGYDAVQISGNGDVAEICRLTCLENNVKVVPDENAPTLVIIDLKIFIDWGDGKQVDPNESSTEVQYDDQLVLADERMEHD